MSTNDVPGHVASNNDELAMGAWAEHNDGSLMLVESTEGGRVIFSAFDVAKDPIIEYRDAMPEINFKRQFSWGGDKTKDRWTWHDKTPFPWDRIIKEGAQEGPRYASADGLKTAAQRVGERLQIRAREYDERHSDMQDRELARAGAIFSRLDRALADLPSTIANAIKSTMGKKPTKRKK